VLAETLKFIVRNVGNRYYGKRPQDNTGQGCMGQSFRKYYKNRHQPSTKELSAFPIVTGYFTNRKVHKNNTIVGYVFPQFDEKIQIINHYAGKCGKWSPEAGNNDYRVLHKTKKYYCDRDSFAIH